MNIKRYQQGEIIFRQWSIGDTMYEVRSGCVGIYVGRGGSGEQKLTELGPGRIFGEMSVLEAYPRSASAVALADTELEEISGAELKQYFDAHPERIMEIMRGLSRRLRELTEDYNRACELVGAWDEAKKQDVGKKGSVLDGIRKFAAVYDECMKYLPQSGMGLFCPGVYYI